MSCFMSFLGDKITHIDNVDKPIASFRSSSRRDVLDFCSNEQNDQQAKKIIFININRWCSYANLPVRINFAPWNCMLFTNIETRKTINVWFKWSILTFHFNFYHKTNIQRFVSILGLFASLIYRILRENWKHVLRIWKQRIDTTELSK